MKAFIFILLFSAFAHAKDLKIVFLGDSLTDGYGVKRELTYPALVVDKLKADGYKKIKLVNASISGSTSASAVERVKWQLKDKPDILFLALGANDGLRGLNLNIMEKNLSDAIETAKKENVEVVLAGMKMPANMGKHYVTKFEERFSQIAKKYKIPFIPFLLEGVAAEKEMNQEDGIHPNEKGHKKMAENVYPHLLKIIEKKHD